MSEYFCMKSKMTSEVALVKALEEVEPEWKGKIIVGKDLPVYGYTGDDRTELSKDSHYWSPKCDIVVPGNRSKHLVKDEHGNLVRENVVGGGANDIGVTRQSDGTLSFVISANEKSQGYNEGWIAKVEQMYHKYAVNTAHQEHLKEFQAAVAAAGHQVVSVGETVSTNSLSHGNQVLNCPLNVTPVKVGIKIPMTRDFYEKLKKKRPDLAAKLKFQGA